MKKIAIVVCVLLLTITVNAQKKNKTTPKKCYVATVSETYTLEKDKQTQLGDLYSSYLKQNRNLGRAFKAEKITKEEMKAKRKPIRNKYFKNFAALVDKDKKELMKFDKETRRNCKNKK